MRKRLMFVLLAVPVLSGTALWSGGLTGGPNSCLQNPPPSCQFDPVCTQNCAAMFPNDPEARCECSLGCCMPID
jgi:hypothetical protein